MTHHQLHPPEHNAVAVPALAAIATAELLHDQPDQWIVLDDEDDAEVLAQLNLQPATVAYLGRVSRLLHERPDDRAALGSLISQHVADLGIKLPGVTRADFIAAASPKTADELAQAKRRLDLARSEIAAD